MKVYDILNEDGRIVKGVNTTPDVGPNEIKTQAAKFGNTVDKDGRPPTLSKKVKGASTNVAFNIGLAEGYNLNEAVPGDAPPPPQLRPKNFDQIVARYKTKEPSALAELIKKFAPNVLIMIAAAIGLAHLSFLQKFLVRQGIKFSLKQMQKAMAQVESIEENFADGKKPGRKGLAKRSGVNTKASVSSLRKTAKNSSGEKQRMAHWLANMKAGKAKKK